MVQIQSIVVERIETSRSEWDAFALKCNASHRGLHGWMKFWQIGNLILFRTIRYSIFHQSAGGRTRIGQCAVGLGLRQKVFADGLQLLPEYQNTWAACMQAVLNKLGPGRYVYGSDWSLEPPREGELSTLAGVAVISVNRHMVEAVDFARWGSWEEYERSVSLNVRRDIKKVQSRYKRFKLEVKRGIEALAYIPQVAYSRSKMLRRKSMPIDLASILKNHAMRSLLMTEYAFSAVLHGDGQVLATFGGSEIGGQVQYFDGGSTQNDGSGWLLMMSLMQDFYRRHPNGRFVMGSSHLDDNQINEWNSSFRYRRDARVSGFPTSVVTFEFS
jgi:hypothetical protein